MSKRSRDDDELVMPDEARSTRLKRNTSESTTNTVVQHETNIRTSSTAVVPTTSFEPKLGKMEKLLMKDLWSSDTTKVVLALKEFHGMIYSPSNRRAETKNRDNARRFGTHALILQIMKKWNENEIILCWCCVVLQILTLFSSDKKKAIKSIESILSLGGMELIVNMMLRFSDSEMAQRNGCAVLANMFHSNTVTDFKKRFIQDMNGISLLVQAMTKNSDIACTQYYGCITLHQLAFESQMKSIIIKGGGASAGIKALEKDFGDQTAAVHTNASNLVKQLLA